MSDLTPPDITADGDDTLGRIILTVTGTHVQADFPNSYFVVEFKDVDDVWRVVRGAGQITGTGTPGPATTTLYDYEAPIGETRSYRAKAVAIV